MRHSTRQTQRYTGLAATLLALPLAAGAAANSGDLQARQAMQEQVVGAKQILRGDVSNGLNPFAGVLDMVLTPDRDRIQYILFRSWYPYNVVGQQSGFVSFRGVTIWNGAGLDTEVLVKNMNSTKAPAELELTAAEARNRLVSNVLGEQLHFPAGDSREVENVLIDRKSGALAAYVVDMDKSSLFGARLRAIPAEKVTFEDGRLSTNASLQSVDGMRKYDPDYL